MAKTIASPKPPAGVSAAARDVWRAIWAEYVFDSRGDIELLNQFVMLIDRLATLRVEIQKHGLVIQGSRGQGRPNPLLAAERDTLRAMLAIHRSLRLQGSGDY